MTILSERRLLQILVVIAGFVPVTAGLLGALSDAAFFKLTGGAVAQSHGAYLSGLLLGVGLGFWSCVPNIEHKQRRFLLLTAVVFVGGLARALAALEIGVAGPTIWFALAMELLVTPGLYLWERRIAGLKPG